MNNTKSNDTPTSLELLKAGLSLIPIEEGLKKPHPVCLDKDGKHNLLYVRANQEEVASWVIAGVDSWAIAGGIVSGNLVTLDFDEKHQFGLYDLWYSGLSEELKRVVDTCYKNSTRNKGTHLRYRTETSQPTVKLARRVEWNESDQKNVIVTTLETRGEGSYALIPPSDGYTATQGSLLDLPLVSDSVHQELIEHMRSFNEVKDKPATEYEYIPGTPTGDRPGDRYNASVSWKDILSPFGWVEESKGHWRRPGKRAGEGISATTDFEDRPILYVFSTSADPFEGSTGYSKFRAFALLNHDGDFKLAAKAAAEMFPQGNGDARNTPNKYLFLNDVCDRKDVTLFHDDQNDAYIAMEISGHVEIHPCSGNLLKKLIARDAWNKTKKTVSSETTKTIVMTIEGKACFEGPTIKLYNRVAFCDGNLWYDLTNEKWQAIKINMDGWEIVDNPPLLFKRYSHHKSQVTPIHNGDINLFLKYVNVANPEHRLLLLVFLVSSFIPDFPHVMLVVFGAQGSAKSTLSKLARFVVDPSVLDVVALPNKLNELVQVLAHHHFLFFDNVSYVTRDGSDTLCKAITGSGFSKRGLYENDEDIIYKFQRVVGLNGINLVTIRPDLLERSLLIELERIDSEKRVSEKEIYDAFEKDLPSILGGVLDVLVRALDIKSRIKVAHLPRMADWALWGCAIAEALGYTKEEFLAAYENNICRQAEMLINENVVATAIITFMKDKEEWRDTPTKTLQRLSVHASFANIDTNDKYWPKGAGILTRRLNELSTYLKQIGILVTTTTTGAERIIHIQKVAKMKGLSSSVGKSVPTDSTDDTDGVFQASIVL